MKSSNINKKHESNDSKPLFLFDAFLFRCFFVIVKENLTEQKEKKSGCRKRHWKSHSANEKRYEKVSVFISPTLNHEKFI